MNRRRKRRRSRPAWRKRPPGPPIVPFALAFHGGPVDGAFGVVEAENFVPGWHQRAFVGAGHLYRSDGPVATCEPAVVMRYAGKADPEDPGIWEEARTATFVFALN